MGASASQPRPTRNPFAAWFAERRHLKKAKVSVAEPSRIVHEEDTGCISSTKQDVGEGKRSLDREEAPREASDSRSRRLGHDYRYITTQDNARMHVGDMYIEQQTVVTNLARSSTETEETKRSEFMENLGFEAMGSRLATIGTAYAETCRWLFDREEYKRWRDLNLHASHNKFLWIKGKPGAGKSTLMKLALQHMQSQNRDSSEVFSFFFNARGHDLEKTTEGMYRSLLHQIYNRFPQRLPKELLALSSGWRTQGWPLPILQNSLRDALLGFGSENRVVCYIDALDECSEDDIRSAVRYFEELGELAHSRAIGLSVCFASRHYPNITLKCHETINLDTEGEHQRDISTFVTTRLRGEHGLRSDLSQQISRRSLGVFLWAALVVQMMNKMMDCGATRSQLLSGLNLVPDGIEELLRTIILDGDLALLSTLQWVLFSKRQLDVQELYFAVKTGVGHLSTALEDAAETSEEQMRLFILTSSKGLVEFTCDDRHPTAQFIHETVREHILNGGLTVLDIGLASNVEAFSHARLGQWCSEYIKASIPPRTQRVRFLMYSRHHMLVHMEIAQSGGALDLLSVDSIPHKTWVSLIGLLDGAPSKKPEAVTPILVLIRSQCTGIAEAILQRQMIHSHLVGDQSHTTTLERLETSAKTAAELDSLCGTDYYNNALQAALRGRNHDGIHPASRGVISPASRRVIETLLRCGADPLLVWKAAHWGTWEYLSLPMHPNSDFIKMSLRFGVDPNTPISEDSNSARERQRTNRDERSALAKAVQFGDESLVESLLSHGASLQRTGSKALLMSAARNGSLSIVQSLVVAGARVDERNKHGRTALHEVSCQGKAEDVALSISRVLIDAGTDIDATDDAGDTALTLAYERQRYDVARLLLDRGADPNRPQHREIASALSALQMFRFDH